VNVPAPGCNAGLHIDGDGAFLLPAKSINDLHEVSPKAEDLMVDDDEALRLKEPRQGTVIPIGKVIFADHGPAHPEDGPREGAAVQSRECQDAVRRHETRQSLSKEAGFRGVLKTIPTCHEIKAFPGKIIRLLQHALKDGHSPGPRSLRCRRVHLDTVWMPAMRPCELKDMAIGASNIAEAIPTKPGLRQAFKTALKEHALPRSHGSEPSPEIVFLEIPTTHGLPGLRIAVDDAAGRAPHQKE